MNAAMAGLVAELTTETDGSSPEAAAFLGALNVSIGDIADRYGIDLTAPGIVEAVLLGTLIAPSYAVRSGTDPFTSAGYAQHALAQRIRS